MEKETYKEGKEEAVEEMQKKQQDQGAQLRVRYDKDIRETGLEKAKRMGIEE